MPASLKVEGEAARLARSTPALPVGSCTVAAAFVAAASWSLLKTHQAQGGEMRKATSSPSTLRFWDSSPCTKHALVGSGGGDRSFMTAVGSGQYQLAAKPICVQWLSMQA